MVRKMHDITTVQYCDKIVSLCSAYTELSIAFSGLCDEGELYKLKDINKKLIASTNRPVNLVSLDYVGRGNVRLADVVRKMNENNVKTFA